VSQFGPKIDKTLNLLAMLQLMGRRGQSISTGGFPRMKTMILSAAAALKVQLAHHRPREPSSPAEP
jgi:hypothetical protein